MGMDFSRIIPKKRVWLKYAYKTKYGQIIEFDRELRIADINSNYFREHFPVIERAHEFDTYIDVNVQDGDTYGGK